MYIDYKTWEDFEKVMYSLKGQFLSPGGVAKLYEVQRGAVYHWINRDNILTAHRYAGPQGSYVIVAIEEFENIDKFRNKEQYR